MSPAPKPKPVGKDTVYIDVDDDITTIIDKVESSAHDIVALVLPKHTSALQSTVNMRLLKRKSEALGKHIVLITKEAALIPLAGNIGLMVARDLQSKPSVPAEAEPIEQTSEDVRNNMTAAPIDEAGSTDGELDASRSVGELAAAHEVSQPETIDLEDDEEPEAKPEKGEKTAKPPRDKRLKVPNFDRFRLLMVGGITLLILLILFFFVGNKVLPKATITLQTEALPLSANFDLTADGSAKSLDEKLLVIPSASKTYKQTATQQVKATGQKNLGNKAKGTVTLSTSDCSGKLPDPVYGGTGISADNLTFILQSRVDFSPTIDGLGNCHYTGSGTVAALEGGTKYNLGPRSDYQVSGRPELTGSDANGMSGGTDDNVTVVSSQDISGAQQKFGDNTSKGKQAFEDQLKAAGYYLVESTLNTSKPTYSSSPAVDQKADTATVTQTITYTGLVVKHDDLVKVITDMLEKQINMAKQKISTDDVLKDASVKATSQLSASNASLSVSESTTAVPIIDEAKLKQEVVGKKKGEIVNLLQSWPGVKNVDVKYSPFWVSTVPKNTSKITIVTQQVTQ